MRLFSPHLPSSAAAMSSRFTYRGRNFRGSGYSQQWGDGGKGFVSGDSHYQAVGQANDEFRHGELGSGGFDHAGVSRQSSQPGGVFFQRRPPLRPPQRRDDHRSWRFVVPRSPAYWDVKLASAGIGYLCGNHSDRLYVQSVCKLEEADFVERFIVVSYNILADYLAKDHCRQLYYHIPPYILNWEWRKKNILFELGLWDPDIICFQEVDQFEDLEKELKLYDYKGVWKRRTGAAIDGCAIFWRCIRFNLLHEESIEFKEFGLKDNVAQICVFECKNQAPSTENGSSLPISSKHSEKANVVIVCNTHVLYNPNRGDIKLGQVRILLDRAHVISRTWNDAPVVVCGDFNCTPKSPLYNFISQQKLDLSGLPKNEVSGQSSAYIHWRESSWPSERNQFPPKNSMWSFVAANSKNNYNHTTYFKEMDIRHSKNDNGLVREVGNSPCNSVAHGIKVGRSSDTEGCTSELPIDSPLSSHKEKEDTIGCEGLNQSLPVDMPNVGSDSNESSAVERADSSCASSHMIESLCPNYVDSSIEKMLDNQVGSGGGDGDTSIENPGTAKKWEIISSLLSRVHSASPLQERIDEEGACITSAMAEETSDVKNTLINSSDCAFDSDPTNQGTDGMESISYNPYIWKPEEIMVASGKVEVLSVEHSLKLKSTYAQVEDYAGTKDASREPQVTSYNRQFMGTVDYIWCSEGLQTVKVLDTIPKHVLLRTPGYPTRKWGSDHLALACQLAFLKDVPSGED